LSARRADIVWMHGCQVQTLYRNASADYFAVFTYVRNNTSCSAVFT